MTDALLPVPADDELEQWLAAQHSNLIGAVTGFLDLEAGLAEVSLYAHHDNLVQGLGQALDMESSLAAILPAQTTVPAHEDAAPVGTESAARDPDLQMHIAALDHRTRLILRNHPVFAARATLERLTGVLTHAGDLVRDFGGDAALDRAFRSARARSAAHFDYLVRELANAFDRVFHLAHDVAREIAHTGARDLDVVHDLGFDLDRAIDRTRELARDLDPNRAPLPTVIRALARARALNLDRALSATHDLAHDLGQAAAHLLGLEVVDGRAARMLQDLLDDFTQADLRGVDLTHVDLEGVRWSAHTTRWPATMDMERLCHRSREIGIGIYVVERGTTATDHVSV
ncbi:hypothetical protein EES41_39790 (plasmid) [Streptomyces sp. ADI95-16]|uniref:hypothetical protein n=1 Tax=Streptomyces sp. ADI95-16 TaxID=1522758 RepID=UPI000F3A9B98|nr:hypothetical protein [Streptomyces sp. ADI95-16]AYV32917.1 hypothetical protein EES41_39790 [Streptomyces sp. ADI95-16]